MEGWCGHIFSPKANRDIKRLLKRRNNPRTFSGFVLNGTFALDFSNSWRTGDSPRSVEFGNNCSGGGVTLDQIDKSFSTQNEKALATGGPVEVHPARLSYIDCGVRGAGAMTASPKTI
jgi:hypothetical protein